MYSFTIGFVAYGSTAIVSVQRNLDHAATFQTHLVVQGHCLQMSELHEANYQDVSQHKQASCASEELHLSRMCTSCRAGFSMAWMSVSRANSDAIQINCNCQDRCDCSVPGSPHQWSNICWWHSSVWVIVPVSVRFINDQGYVGDIHRFEKMCHAFV